LDLSGLQNRVIKAATNIDFGRKGFAIAGKERAGRIAYEEGIADVLSAFNEAQITADPQTIITAEYTFLSEELHLCDARDKNSLVSLASAIESFDEAFICLEIVEKHNLYQAAEKTYSRRSKCRIKGFPRDAFHFACASHRTRLQNMLSATGLDLIEKSLLEQRRSNLTTAQSSYIKKQKIALAAPKSPKKHR